MTRILFIGQKPETVDFSDPSLPPGFNAEKINAGIAVAVAKIEFETVVNIIHKAAPKAATPIDRVALDGFGHWAFSQKAEF